MEELVEHVNDSIRLALIYLTSDHGVVAQPRPRLLGTLATIGAITEDGALSDAEKVTRIRALLATRQTQRQLQKDQVATFKEALVDGDQQFTGAGIMRMGRCPSLF